MCGFLLEAHRKPIYLENMKTWTCLHRWKKTEISHASSIFDRVPKIFQKVFDWVPIRVTRTFVKEKSFRLIDWKLKQWTQKKWRVVETYRWTGVSPDCNLMEDTRRSWNSACSNCCPRIPTWVGDPDLCWTRSSRGSHDPRTRGHRRQRSCRSWNNGSFIFWEIALYFSVLHQITALWMWILSHV